MKIYIFIAALFAALALTSCDNLGTPISPSGKVTTQTLNISGITGVDVHDAFNVRVQFSETEEKVEIQANENLHRYVEVTKKGQVVEIGLVKGVNIKGNATLNAVVTTKNMNRFYASGASVITVEDSIKDATINIDLSGASQFNGLVWNDKIIAGLSGASVLNLSGVSTQCNLDMSGASATKTFDFSSDYFTGDFSGASAANISIQKSIQLKASGASILNYQGNATIDSQDLSGGSSIHKVN